jgi:hypothetical protein
MAPKEDELIRSYFRFHVANHESICLAHSENNTQINYGIAEEEQQCKQVLKVIILI